MFRKRPTPLAIGLILLLGGGARLAASPVSDFQARLAQTVWCLAQVEGILRTQPESLVTVATPEALGSFLVLASENVGALTAAAAARMSEDQRRPVAEGLKATARNLKDLISLANNRGLTSAATALSALESNCRVGISQIGS